jgi:hypothetical protein
LFDITIYEDNRSTPEQRSNRDRSNEPTTELCHVTHLECNKKNASERSQEPSKKKKRKVKHKRLRLSREKTRLEMKGRKGLGAWNNRVTEEGFPLFSR